MSGTSHQKPVATLSASEVKARLERGEIRLVDVREPDEWASGHIPGALLVPLSRFEAEIGSVPIDRPVVLHCRSGARSARALALCRTLGLQHDCHMEGGIEAWRAAGYPTTR
jgi:rhodanese-related sulfurtransferase